MRFAFLTISVLCCFLSLAQIPDGYYDQAEGKSGSTLKAALYDIIKGHTEYPYTSTNTDVWDILKQTDKDPNNASNVIGIYSRFSMNAAQEYNNGSGWSREHVWAQSRGDLGTSMGPGTDVHHIRAADISTNSARSNRNFVAECDKQYIDGGGATPSYTCTTEYSWEPPDEVKGDIARMLFYMATRYEGDGDEPDLELTDILQSQTANDPLHAKLSVLLQWHVDDPVDQTEINRNDIIYGFQNNRNPFIDHPEYVDLIWGTDDGGDEETPPLSASVSYFRIFPNPSNTVVHVEANSPVTSFTIFDLQGKPVSTETTSGSAFSIDVHSFESGLYLLVLSLKDGSMSHQRMTVF